jgi:hypothetical protein
MTQGEDRAKMVNAALRLANDHKGRCVNSRLYSLIKLERAKYLSETTRGANNSFFGKKHTDETKRKMSESRRKWSYTDEHIEKFKGRTSPMKGKTHSESTKQRLSEVGKMRKPSQSTKEKTSETLLGLNLKRSNSTKEKMRQSKLGVVHPIKTCGHCGKEITVAMFARWHGDKCKFKDKSESHQLTKPQ